jgi:FAD:protein FMN transferase
MDKPRWKERWGAILLVLLGAGANGIARAAEVPTNSAPAPLLLTWEGRTMGTTYMVKIAGVAQNDALGAELMSAVEAGFDEINREMSNYQPDSELSRFNSSTSLAPIKVSAEFAKVVRHALALNRDSGGAFDPTVGPLVNLWGFGPAGRRADPPAEAEIAALLPQCGAGHLQVTSQDELQKDIPGLQLDLGGVAKGYGSDVAAQILRDRGYSNIFVAVCGEIVAFGNNPEGTPWQVGVERPIQDLPRGADYSAIVSLSGRALSTSGDTYNYFRDVEGTTYSHILDPATGWPIQHKLASVTVIAPNGLTADGLATTLYVMGPERGLEWIEAHPDYAALFIVRTGEDEFKLVASSRFPAYQPVP